MKENKKTTKPPIHGGIYKTTSSPDRWLFLRHPTKPAIWCVLLLREKLDMIGNAPLQSVRIGRIFSWQQEIWADAILNEPDKIGFAYLEPLSPSGLKIFEKRLRKYDPV